MTHKKDQSSRFNRRQFLGTLAITLAGISSLPLLSRLRGRTSKKTLDRLGLPGKGSIFEPKNDARLQEWLRKNQ
ncbi:MAG: hypothetical protein FI680_01185 [SAR202 cluster bacterium]|nr:hypothetical protein [SAR202 cluster bacterium]